MPQEKKTNSPQSESEKKRKKGERSDGRIQIRVNIGRDERGKIKYKYFYGHTKKEAVAKAEAFKLDLLNYGKPLDTTTTTLSEWTYKHLFTNIHPTVSASTFERYMTTYNNHIKGTNLGNMNIKDIEQIHIQNYLNEKSSLSKSYLKKIKQLLNNSFRSAISNNLIRINPVDCVKLPTSEVKEKTIEILTQEEQKAYTKALNNELYGMLFLTALYTGMRMGEIIALKWDNVDLINNTITVMESYKRVKRYNKDGSNYNDIDKKAPKTTKGNRIIPIPAFLSKALKEYKLSSTNSADNLVFCTESGHYILDSNIRKYHQRVCKNANIRQVSFHALRHTYATRSIENGIDIKTVSELLGHASVEITLNTYVHSTGNTKRAAADALDKMYSGLFG